MEQDIRQKAIKDLIATRVVEDQQSLVKLLKKEHGIETNQTTVSRDLHKLGVTKVLVGDKSVYEIADSDPAREILKLGVARIEHNEMMIVVHTLAGLAPFVGDQLDARGGEIGVMATLAGENAIFVMPVTTKKIKETYQQVCKALHYKRNLK